MRIVFYAGGMPFNGDTVKTQSLGGSESAAYYLARELARNGHEVFVFTSLQATDMTDDVGVSYIWHGECSQGNPLGTRFEHYAQNTPHDVLMIQRIPFAFTKLWASKVNIWQLHDLALFRSAGQMLNGTWQIDAVTTVSEWHRQQVNRVYNIPLSQIHAVPNGVDPTLYAKGSYDDFAVQRKPAGETRMGRTAETVVTVPQGKSLLLYQSRPERGLLHLLHPEGIMARCAKLDLPVHLLYCTYAAGTVPHFAEFYAKLDAWGAALPNVSNIGSLTKAQLAALQRQCDVLVYPTEFEEVSCITAMEAMHAGLPLLTTDSAALPETCADSGTVTVPLLDPTGTRTVNEDEFVARLQDWFTPREGVTAYPQELNDLRKRQLEAAHTRTWRVAAAKFEELIRRCFAERQKSAGGILRNALEHSDIRFAKWYADEYLAQVEEKPARTTVIGGVVEELDRMYQFIHSSAAYVAHYEKNQKAFYDEFGEKMLTEDVTSTTRYRGVLHFMAEANNAAKGMPLRVLDYGCAHGHYLFPLAKTFPDSTFAGLDISHRAISTANARKDLEKASNVSFQVGAQDALNAEQLGTFDVIIAGEILEHVWDYAVLLARFQRLLRPSGCIIVTTPTGRWEHTGTIPFRIGREHLHHFERADIQDITHGHDFEILHAPASHDRSGFPVGSYVWRIRPTPGVPLWKVDYDRKLRQYAGRQSVSVCMILKNAEQTLQRCVESYVDWVDQIILCIDPTTTDRTEELARQLAADFPNRPFVILRSKACATIDGFEAARNESLSYATGDWIVWIDADEEMRTPWNLHRLARPSMHDGYGFPQVHYAVDPDQVLTSDYPCRMFRNHKGIRFYGLVHEHPESEIGKAVTMSLVRPELKFLHHGYFDEETRRKRFERNFPLLQRDVEKYPTQRPLNKYLLLRDIAQSIVFDAQKAGGYVLPEFVERARRGIKIMEEIVTMPQLRMIVDALPYYSQCVVTSGGGFEAEVSLKTSVDAAPEQATSYSFRGRFHSREFYTQLITKFSQETTKLYEERYL